MRGNGIAGKAFSGEGCRRGARSHRGTVSVLALVGGVCVLSFATTQMAGAQPVAENVDTGFVIPFAGGAPVYESVAPTQMTTPDQLNQPLGQQTAEEIAAQIGLEPADALTEEQYRDLMAGGGGRWQSRGCRGDRRMRPDSHQYERAAPLYSGTTPSVLASYGLYVNPDGLLESPANADAPTRQVNTLIAPGGFVGTWLRNNGATHTLIALYQSAYTVQAVYGFAAQQISGAAQLVANTKGDVNSEVGMSMAPPLWIVNFALLYILKPSLAAAMPAHCSHSACRCRRRESESHRSSRFQ